MKNKPEGPLGDYESLLSDAEIDFLRELDEHFYIFQDGIGDYGQPVLVLREKMGPQALRSLEERGLIVVTQTDPDDRRVESARSRTITITEKGKGLIQKQPPVFAPESLGAEKDLSPEAALAVAELFRERLGRSLKVDLESLPELEESVEYWRKEEAGLRDYLARRKEDAVLGPNPERIRELEENLARITGFREEAERMAIAARQRIVENRKTIERAQMLALGKTESTKAN